MSAAQEKKESNHMTSDPPVPPDPQRAQQAQTLRRATPPAPSSSVEEAKEAAMGASSIYHEMNFCRQHYTPDEIKAAAVKFDQSLDALIAAVASASQHSVEPTTHQAFDPEQPDKPLKLNAYGRACYRAGQASSTAASQQQEKKDFSAGLIHQTIPDVDDTEPRPVCGNCDQPREIHVTTDDDVDLCAQCYEELREDMMVRDLKQVGSVPVVEGEASTDTAQERSEKENPQFALQRPSGSKGQPIESVEVHSQGSNQRPSGATWEPIETAPKDRTRVLLRVPFEAGTGYEVQIGAHDDDYKSRPPQPFWRYDSEFLGSTAYSRAHHPSHWMPLPPIPAPSGEEK